MAKILVADDSPTSRQFLVTLLSYSGHHLVEAADGAEALEVARAEHPDLVIADILMPTMDGYEFVQRLHADASISNTPVIFYSATYVEREAHALAEACGVSRVLIKPSDPEDVLRTVNEALGLKPAPVPPSPPEDFARRHLHLVSEKLFKKLEELEAANSRLTALIELGLQVASERDPQRLVEKHCVGARKIIGAKYCGVGIVNDDGKTLRHFFISGLDSEAAARIGSSSVAEGAFSPLHLTRQPRRLRDFSTDPEALGLLPPNHPPLKSFLGVPIASPTAGYGRLYLGNKLGAEEFSEEDERIAATLAAQLAVAYENARLYEEIQSRAAQLEQAIGERKKVEGQLLQAQKMEAIGRLAGGIAHDFNNLLTIITGYSQLLLERLGSPHPLQVHVEEIKKAGERAASLTRQLLAFSRRQVLLPQVLDLNTVAANMDKMLRRLIGEDIDLVTVPRTGLGRVKADPGQIEQVIMNLAVNARDAMPKGGKLTIETANVELDGTYARAHVGVTPGPYVMLAMSDTGCGMDAETQSHLFEPFFTTKEQGKGTGLGLSTVYGIVKQSGGNIWVYSEPGQGTTFKIYLPQVEEAVETREARGAQLSPAGGSETILVVEDEPALRALVRRVLESNGYTVLEAQHGEDALLVCEQSKGPIHLLLTDVVMPQMSGRELAEHLAPFHRKMKVLYMSGYTDNAILHHGVLDPGTAFLQKPFTPDALARKVREVLNQ